MFRVCKGHGWKIFRPYHTNHYSSLCCIELAEKSPQLPKEIKWHFIGSCQSNKLKLLASIPNLFVIETIDSLKKATILNKAIAAESPDRRMNIYLQINTSGEDCMFK